MSNKSWQKSLDNFLAENTLSTDARVIARALSNDNELTNKERNDQHLADIEKALHIEQHLDEIGLQPIPEGLANKLQTIGKANKNSHVIFGVFSANWKKVSAIAATITAITLLNSNMVDTPASQQPTLAEIKHAQQELTLELQYISFAKTKSAHQIKRAFDENIQQPLNKSLFKPLNYFKETS